jgi:transposase
VRQVGCCLGRITKAGDSYLRSLLVMGARAILSGLGDKSFFKEKRMNMKLANFHSANRSFVLFRRCGYVCLGARSQPTTRTIGQMDDC